MEVKNVLIAGVGGQGLVLTTKIISMAAFSDGYDIKSGDVIGLSQRGGAVWGSLRFGQTVASPIIPNGAGDILVAFEELEALRHLHLMKKDALILLNRNTIYPNRVLIEKDKYPEGIGKGLTDKGYKVFKIDAKELARKSGNVKTESMALIGLASLQLPFSYDSWLKGIKESVPVKTIDDNIRTFDAARDLP